MAYFSSLRNDLGLSSTVFAGVIGCSRGHLSMAEGGKRNLPASAVQLLHKLEVIAHENIQGPADFSAAKKTATLRKLIRSRQLLLDKMQLKRTGLLQKQEQAKRLIQLATAIEAEPLLLSDEVAILQMRIAKRQAQKKMSSLERQSVEVQVGIAGLEAEIAKAEELKK